MPSPLFTLARISVVHSASVVINDISALPGHQNPRKTIITNLGPTPSKG